MGFYTERILPCLTHWLMRSPAVSRLRTHALAAASGRVLEIGFGSGLNLPYYPRHVKRVDAIEPSRIAGRMASAAIAEAPFPVSFVGADAQQIPRPDASVDCVVSTWTLCTIPDPDRALREIARVLVPGGLFLFVEHGRAPDARVARWQDRLNGLEQSLAGGCRLDREIDNLVRASPLELTRLETGYQPGPKTHTFMYIGQATKVA